MSDIPARPGTTDVSPDLAIGAQRPSGFVAEGRLVQEFVRDRVPGAPHDLVAVYDARTGVVILEGTPADEDTRRAIVEVARDVEGVAAVEDRMRPAAA